MRRVQADVLRAAMKHALAPFSLTDEHVAFVVETLVATSLDGIDTHGVRLLETYVGELEGGRCNPRPKLALTSTLPAVGLLDADDALGVVAANEAIRHAVARARTFGIGCIAVANSNHCGAAGYYTTLAAKAGMIGLAFSNSDALVAPFNGRVALNGTNPIAMSAPGVDGEIFALDMSTSQTSFLKALRTLASLTDDTTASPVPPPTKLLDPLQPLGGYKGQGLGMLVQILAAVLTAMPFDHQLANMYDAPYDKGRKIAHLFVCLEIAAFTSLDGFRARLGELSAIFRACPAVDPTAPVVVPGDAERRARRERVAMGIPLTPPVWSFYEPHIAAIERTC
jgi:ureidoglycolate dehydrogenase (NAD+)